MSRHRGRRHPRGMAWSPPDEESGYDGTALLTVGSQSIEVIVHLDGHLEPLDGRFHWYGRVERSTAVRAVKDAGATRASLIIGNLAPADVRLAEYDPWGHLQVSGIGEPPYPMESVEIDLPA